ncbi:MULTISPECIES: AfsR/SARP family transcriptional regulator [unclassified Streptomyces]|uniref:AfsR/SARP family transcriptional regulator n=1 Tax=unclassified Streptomyces TaxID=2593676 RepID=UPI00278BBC03|nr:MULTISPECIES: AfsR/SARP family transcriptional regulator [unclassified Streptomyces]
MPLGPPKQRAVLGLLASQVGRVTGIDQIIDAVWGSDVPQSAVNCVHTYVAGLRRILEPERGPRESGGVLVSAGGGYALSVDPTAIDAGRFALAHGRARRLLSEGDRDGGIAAYEEAHALWRGEAYANVPGPFAALERARLHEARLTAVEEWAEALLAAGRHTEVITVLTDMIARDPLREKLRWLLMLGLHRSGRRAHALTVYRETHRLLQEELGIDPGTELRRLHQQILGDHAGLALRAPAGAAGAGTGGPSRGAATVPAPSVRPAQLPPGARGFTGRAEELARLRNVVERETGEGHAAVAVVEGPPGAGKTALALQLAHELGDRYPDGKLFADLRGSHPDRPPLEAREVLAQLLGSLGVPPQQLPVDPAGRTALFRSLLHGRRVLIVLDDALHAEQVRPLIPRGPACVLVTSRRRQFGLAARDGAYRIEIGPLAPQESVNLLSRVVGRERLDGQWDAARDLARMCGHLPLALRIAAAGLLAKPALPLAELVDTHAPCRGSLDWLAVEDDVAASLRTAFQASVRLLPEVTARVFGVLGLLESEPITVSEAAEATALSPEVTARQLAVLADHHLLEEVGRDRFRFINLIGLYAAEYGRGTRADRDSVRDRLLRRPVPIGSDLVEAMFSATDCGS